VSVINNILNTKAPNPNNIYMQHINNLQQQKDKIPSQFKTYGILKFLLEVLWFPK